MQRLNKNAADIASATNPQSNVNLTESIVELNANKQQVEASAKVVSANSEIIGSLLDIKV
jgi:flagellar basal body rod protein FlgG